MSKIRIGVLRGGPSEEHDVSLQSGENVLRCASNNFETTDIVIARDGAWNAGGMMTSPVRAMRQVDVFFNALHGTYGEDGKLQRFLEAHDLAFTGSGSLASSFGMNKILSKKRFKTAGLKTPEFVIFTDDIDASSELLEQAEKRTAQVLRTIPAPWIVKPVSGGSSVGVSYVRSADELLSVLEESLRLGAYIFVEQAIVGKEVTCGVLENFRGRRHFALPPLEITSGGSAGYFDYESKYNGSSREVPYGSLCGREIERVQDVALRAHQGLGLRHYSRSDMILGDNGDLYILEVNSLPGLTSESLLPKSLEAVGLPFGSFVEHTVNAALMKHR